MDFRSLRVLMVNWMFTFTASGDRRLRLPNAAGFLGKHIPGQGISSCPRPAADLAEFTNAALAFQVLAVTQRDKKRRKPIDLRQRLLAYVSSGDGQKTAGEYFSKVRNEDEALAIVDSAGASDAVCSTCAEQRRN